MVFARFALSSPTLLFMPPTPPTSFFFLLRFSSSYSTRLSNRNKPSIISAASSFSSPQTCQSPAPLAEEEGDKMEEIEADNAPRTSSSSTSRRPWRPMCLYYTQGKCNMMDDAVHLQKFNHSFLLDLQVNASTKNKLRPQKLDYLLVLDLEGKVEILEFPVVIIDCRTMDFVHSFHRFVRPSVMSEQRLNEYIKGKYGRFGVDRVWHDTAIPFNDVLQQFGKWLSDHNLWNAEQGGSLNRAAFVTCGNWDLKTKVPDQCGTSKIKLPSFFMEWINLKDIYLNFYNRRATGMMTMMRELQMPLMGNHHLGLDDAMNIARVTQRMLADGVLMQITARRKSSATVDVEFFFKNRV